MKNAINGIVRFYLEVMQDDEKTETKYKIPARIFSKDQKYFLFFDENNNDNSHTKCRFEFDEKNLRMRRVGDIITEQMHVENEMTEGYFKTPYGHLETKFKTHKYKLVKQPNSTFKVHLAYDLYVSDELAGIYKLELEFEGGA